MLLTLEDQLGTPSDTRHGLSVCALLVLRYWPEAARGLPAKTADGPVLEPFVNRGRWLVACPTCGSAARAARSDRRFFCCECGNIAAGGRWLPVVWPAETAGIESALMRRALYKDRAWTAGESAADLEAETVRLADTGAIRVVA